MGDGLYLVTVKAEVPGFLSAGISLASSDISMHHRFLSRVREHHPGFRFPYLAMFGDGSYQVPTSLVDYEFGSFEWEDDTVEVVIGRYLGRPHYNSLGNRNSPVTGLVQFSEDGSDLFPMSLDRLCRGHDVKRIELDSID
jgi:hypothetical protein